jgi:hypothetical protein
VRVIIRIAARVIALTVVAAVLVLSAGSGHSLPSRTELVTNPPSCC